MRPKLYIAIGLIVLFNITLKAQNCWEYEEYQLSPTQRIGGGVVISEVYFDSHYSEELFTKYHHFGEYIELFNSSTQDLEVSGWKIQDYKNYYIFPDNTIIPSGGHLIITYGGRINPNSPSIGIQKGKEKFIELFPEAFGREDQILVQNHFVLWNDYAQIELYNQFGLLIDQVTYGKNPQCDVTPECNYVADIENGNGGVFNGPIYTDTNERLVAQGFPPLTDPNAIKYYKRAIYKELPVNYYDNEDFGESYLIADASPFSIPFSITLQEPSEGLYASPPPPAPSANNLENFNPAENYIYSEVYDVFNTMVGKSGGYFNGLGRPTTSYSWDQETNKVWGTEIKYDGQGRPAMKTFSSPKCNGFRGGFLNGNYNNYVSDDTNYNGLATINAVNNNASSLKRYYSDENSNEAYQATTDRPFSRTVYDKLNPGNIVKTIGGNQMDGEWKSSYSFTIPAAQELYYVFGKDYFNGPLSAFGEEVITKFYKTIVIDAQGVENVVFTDGEGKILASARSGGSQAYNVISVIGEQGFVDIHIPLNSTSFNFLTDNSDYTIYDLKTGNQIDMFSISPGNVYRIQADVSTNDYKTYIHNSSNSIIAPNAKGIRYSVNYYEYAVNYYDDTGRLYQSSQPTGFNASCLNGIQNTVTHGMLSTYSYNTLGELIETTSPDEGNAKFKYRKDGQIRFSQNSKQSLVNEVSFTDYDDLARPVKSGVGTANFISLNPDTDLVTTDLEEVHETLYDDEDPDLEPLIVSNGLNPNEYRQSFLSGNVSMTASLPDGIMPNTRTWYNYDIYGRVIWTVQHIEGLGLKTVHYKYDHRGNVKQVIYQKDVSSELFIHQYTYNLNDNIVKVETSTDGTNFSENATYDYYKSGELKRTEIANGIQGMDYVYTLGGQLKSINSPNLDMTSDPGKDVNDLFGMTIDYYNGDYIRSGNAIMTSPSGTNRYDGNIKATRWATKGLTLPNTQNAYTYEYNRNNWLTEATFGNVNTPDAVIASNADYKVSNITYDANGNIETLNRTKDFVGNSNEMDDFTYEYNDNTNQLNHINDAVSVSPPDADDLESQSPNTYEYNDIGQLIRNNQEGITYEYNAIGLVTNIKKTISGELVVSFEYDDKNQRIAKQSYTNGIPSDKIYYIRDTGGNPIGIYKNSNLEERPIYGASRLGIRYQDDSEVYQFTDHLGNVRALAKPEIGADPIIYQEDFDNTTTPSSWVQSSSNGIVEISIENQQLKCVFNRNYRGVRLNNIPLEANKTYQFSYQYIKQAMQADFHALLYKGGSNWWDFPPVYNSGAISDGGDYTFTFEATETSDYILILRGLTIPGYPNNTDYIQPNTFYIDNVEIKDVSLESYAYTDYYPFGMPMPNRNVDGGYRYGYQGEYAEKEPELGNGINSFQVRLYDSRIGRWLTVDPAGEFFSPYLAMANNPISTVDPDGACTNCSACPERCKGLGIDKIPDGQAIWNGPNDMDILDAAFDPSAIQLAGVFIGSWQEWVDTYVTPLRQAAANKRKEVWMDDFYVGMSEMRMGAMDIIMIATLPLDLLPMGLSKIGTTTATRTLAKTGDNFVYLSKNADGIVDYVGITNNLVRRAGEHLAQKGIRIRGLAEGLSRADARAVEQVLIEIHGLSKHGGTLMNKINSISKTNPVYAQSLKRGREILDAIGYVY